MEQLVAVVALGGMIAAAVWGLMWLGRAGRENRRQSDPLTPADLRALEESVAHLMADLRATADECVARVNAACDSAKALGCAPERTEPACDGLDRCESAVQSARRMGVSTGEVELLRGLRSIGMLSASGDGSCRRQA